MKGRNKMIIEFEGNGFDILWTYYATRGKVLKAGRGTECFLIDPMEGILASEIVSWALTCFAKIEKAGR
jgi:hypothetical protein